MTYVVKSSRPIEKEKREYCEKKKMGRLNAFIWGSGKREKGIDKFVNLNIENYSCCDRLSMNIKNPQKK